MIALPERVIGIGRNGRSQWPECAGRAEAALRLARAAPTFASHLVMRGVPLKTVQELKGPQQWT